MQLILIRHGLPLRVVNTDGSPADPSLSERGHAQAARMARCLAVEPLDGIYASPMRRAHETAMPLAEALELEIVSEPRIAEFDRDADLYIPLEELKETDYEAWQDFMRLGYPAGVDLEVFQRGVIAGMEEIITDNAGKNVAVVCHGGVINVWTAHLLEIGRPMFFAPEYASISRFYAASGGERSLASLNETQHLGELTGKGE